MKIDYLLHLLTISFLVVRAASSNAQEMYLKSRPATAPKARDGTITLDLPPGYGLYSCLWEGPADFQSQEQSLHNLFPGNYCVTLLDSNQVCEVQCIHLAYQCPDLISGIKVRQPDRGKSNGHLHPLLLARKGKKLFFHWNTGSQLPVLKGLSSGYYSLTVSNEGGCREGIGIPLVEKSKNKNH